jgi:carboxymethylenebutenolidase
MIEFRANGRMASGYLARPKRGTGAGIIVLQEYWGLVGHITDVADRLAAQGFFALAPDLYHGEQAKSPDEAGKLMMALDIAEAAKELRGAAEYLLGIPNVQPKRVAAIGFCMGGQLALYAACEFPDWISAVVDFYGVHPKVNPDVSRLSGPVLAHFAEHDRSVTPDAVAALVARIQDAGKEIEVHSYDAKHAFFNDQRPQVYDRAAAELAWVRTLEFLRRVIA